MVQFQIVDILSDDIPNGKKKEFQISIYGKTSDNKSIICNVIGFKPYFYLKVPDHWKYQKVSMFLKDVGDKDDPKNRRMPDVGTDVFMMNGYDGQRIYMVPSKNAVVVRMGKSKKGDFDFNAFLSGVIAVL